MNGSPDFRPEPGHRASDPSLEEMLRRARDARLGDATDRDRPTPLTYGPPPHKRRDSRFRDWLLVAAGILVGVLLSIAIVNVAGTIGSWTTPVATSAPTPLPTVTPTATPFRTATTPVVEPPATVEIINLVQDYYDNQGPYAGSYIMRDVTDLQIQGQTETELAACVSYEAASVNAPDAATVSDTRLFTLVVTSDGGWQVVQMGGSNSCQPT